MISTNPQVGTQAPAPAAVSTSASVPLRSILIVDDESTLRSALRRFFMRRGWRVVEAEDGECARAMLLDGDVPGGGFDAVFSDLRMPRMNGMELYATVASADAALARRFIFSSGDTGDDEATAFLERTRCPAVSKPFELGLLLSMVERVAADAPPTN
jgi:DNA-binding NtrC family response regulator